MARVNPTENTPKAQPFPRNVLPERPREPTLGLQVVQALGFALLAATTFIVAGLVAL